MYQAYRISFLFIIFTAFTNLYNKILAQTEISQYLFQSSIQPYIPVTGGFVLGNTTTDDQVFIDSVNLTGGFSPATGRGFYIGFPFTYGSRVFTHIAVSADGAVKLGNGIFTIRRNTTLMSSQTTSDSADYNDVLAIYNADLEADEGSSINIVRQGTPGNRVCIIQWSNYKPFGTNYIGDQLNFQIQLRESNMSIVYHFGSWVRGITTHVAGLGLRGRNNNIFHNRVIRNDSNATWLNSRRTNARGNQVISSSTFIPEEGLLYEFFYQPPTPNNLAATKLIIDQSTGKFCKPTSVTPIGIKFNNAGTDPQSAFQVGYMVNGGSPIILNVNLSSPLLPGASDSVLFTANPIDMTNEGTYKIQAFVNLPNELPEYRINDTIMQEFRIIDTLSVPTPSYNSFNAALNLGFRTGIGDPTPVTWKSNRWGAGNIQGASTIAVTFPAGTANNPTILNDWIINGPYKAKPGMNLIFRVAAIVATGTTSPSLGDDVVSIVYSTDCGNTWNSIFNVNQSAVNSGNIPTSLKAFEVSLSGVTSDFLLGIRASTNNPNTTGQAYLVHFSDMKIKIGTDFDIMPIAFYVSDTTTTTCNISRANLKMLVKNLGTNPVSSFTVAYRTETDPLVTSNILLNPPLATGDVKEITFTGTRALTISSGSIKRVTAYTSSPNEDFLTRQNDTLRTVIFQRNNTSTVALPDSNRFENQQNISNWFIDNNNPFGFRVRPQRGIQNSGALSGIVNVSSGVLLTATPKYGPIQGSTKMRFFYRFVEEVSSSQGAQFNPSDSIVLRASNSCGLAGKRLYAFNNQTHAPTLAYRAVIVDLADLAGQTPVFTLSGRVSRLDFAGARFEIDNFYIGDLVITDLADGIIANDRFAAYPNPAKIMLHIELFNQAKTYQCIELIDIHGRVVKKISSNLVDDHISIPISDLQSGIYLLKVHYNGMVSTQKIIVQP